MASTPILDRLKPLPAPQGAVVPDKKKTRLRDIAIVSLVIVGTALWITFMIASPYAFKVSQVLGGWIDRLLPVNSSSVPSVLTVLWYLGVTPLLAISYTLIIHECGHLLAGLCVNFRLLTIRVGPLEIRPPFRVSLTREFERGPAGIVKMLPSTTAFLRPRIATMVLAGPAANLATAILLPRFTGESAISAWLILLSYVIGISNLVPFRGKNFDSDGRRLLMLARGGAQPSRQLAILKLVTDFNNEVEPKDLRPEWIAMATAIRDDSAQTMMAHLLAYSAAWYRSTVEETGHLLEIVLEHAKHATGEVRAGLICEAGVFQARKCGSADLAREWLADLHKEEQSPVYAVYVEAAILEAEDNIPRALAKLDEAENLALALPNGSKKRLKLKWLKRWRSELQTLPGSVPVSRWSHST
ncbi:MAG: hypothetical protein DMG65_23520 [Candidatus Angelobacter sp. Gp1-AA117]|nr:MAG: hypothetical protein DMG65_23520 [Candidatus Angelobacter sp. Gp1-AA117]